MSAETSERLLANVEKIISSWEKRAKAEIVAATNQESLLLRDELHELLFHLAHALSTTIDRNDVRVRWDLDEGKRVGKLHGLNRAEQASYTIDQLIFEFHILRQVICDVMEDEVAFSNIEREIITCSIEQYVNDAATEFSITHSKIQQEFVHTLIHDLRGPITAAKIIAQQLLRKFGIDECIAIAAKRITKNMDRLDLMIQDLLDFGKLKTGEPLPLEFKESDLNTIIAHTVEDLNFIYNNRFKYISSGECLGIWSTKGLKRLIENLAINAVKYGSPDSEILIRLDDSGEKILLSVHNEGAPIPLEDQEFLFKKHSKPRGAEDKTGWGLGLTIVQAMTYAHHGTVEVESAAGKGTTFIVKFPKSEAFNSTQHTPYSANSSLPLLVYSDQD